jgi:hypothetical protein
LKQVEKFAAKDAAEDLDGEEEGILAMNPARNLNLYETCIPRLHRDAEGRSFHALQALLLERLACLRGMVNLEVMVRKRKLWLPFSTE